MVASGKSQSEPSFRATLPGLTKPTGTFYRTTAFLSKLSIILSVLAVFAILSIFSPSIIQLQRTLEKPVPRARCVVYDRPPRTGSTTISGTLAKCLISRGYDVADGINQVRSIAVRRMIASDRDRIAMARTHVSFSEDDMELFEKYCGKMLYITGSAPMKKRLYSALKYSVKAGHGNSTIDRDMVAFAKKARTVTRSREGFYEAYPFVTDERTPKDFIPERIVPDYVIRKDNLVEDFQALLHAMKCNATIKSNNVHVASTEENKVLDTIELQHGDVMYKWLTEVAKDNDLGLKKAREFGEK